VSQCNLHNIYLHEHKIYSLATSLIVLSLHRSGSVSPRAVLVLRPRPPHQTLVCTEGEGVSANGGLQRWGIDAVNGSLLRCRRSRHERFSAPLPKASPRTSTNSGKNQSDRRTLPRLGLSKTMNPKTTGERKLMTW
jgi:hypothetical protein